MLADWVPGLQTAGCLLYVSSHGLSSVCVERDISGVSSSLFFFLVFKIDFREREGREKETLICCSTYLCIHR